MIAALIIIWIVAVGLFIWALCDTSSDADDRLAEMALERQRREFRERRR